MKNTKKKAFTLAEVLITLVIIGVVAAITVPVIITNYQRNVTAEKVKMAYSIVSQAVNRSIVDNGYISTWDVPRLKRNDMISYEDGLPFFEKYLLPYFNVMKRCEVLSTDCWVEESKFLDGKHNEYLSSESNYFYSIVLNNGMVIGFWPRGTEKFIEIDVDINGKDKPNVMGKDQFNLVIALDAFTGNFGHGIFSKPGVYLTGEGFTREELISKSTMGCSSTSGTWKGTHCGALIQRDGWEVKY